MSGAGVNAAVSAPGKLFLAGEYGVLHGGIAVVAAVDRRAVARFVPGAAPATPLIAEALKVVREDWARRGRPSLDGAPQVDSSALADGTRKLGLGSSAAAIVAAIGALIAAEGRDVAGSVPAVLALALRAHRAAQGGRGSGGDVAAAAVGGVIAFSRGAAADDPPTIRPLAPTPPVELVVFSAGAPVATTGHLRAVERLAARDRAAHARCLSEIAAVAAAFAAAYEAADVPALLSAVAAAHQALDALGQAADLPIVTPALGTAAGLARALGGAAKPSGAGGGDVGVAFFGDPDSAAAFREEAPKRGLPIIRMNIDAHGVARDD